MLEAAYADYTSSETAPPDLPTTHPSVNPSRPINGGAQGSGDVGGNVIIEMSVTPSVVANG